MNTTTQEVTEIRKNTRVIMLEWISTIAIFISCFAYLSYKIEKQSERTDRLYEMFIEIVKERK